MKAPRVAVSGFVRVSHLRHFGCRSAGRLFLRALLLDVDAGHVQRAQQHVGLEGQMAARGRHQLQRVQRGVEVVAAAQLHQQVHQRLARRASERKRERGERGGGEWKEGQKMKKRV